MTEHGPTVIEPTAENIATWLLERVAYYLDEPTEAIDAEAPLAHYGLDSVYALALCGDIEDTLSVSIEPTLIWDVENLVDLTGRLVELVAERPRQ
ncbi:acyl carrier protein [Streptomyces hyaluromycini]|uniref:Acyl carrier protein n=1 Tax=Streptomyces hyaluromycini TaxID=1377993 RepID=A0ABV1WMY7_9ACTN